MLDTDACTIFSNIRLKPITIYQEEERRRKKRINIYMHEAKNIVKEKMSKDFLQIKRTTAERKRNYNEFTFAVALYLI